MGTSTVSGPFRSANGFQQLDENGVWVPVTGGGGGGGGVTLIPYTVGSTMYTVTGLTNPGDSASFIWEVHSPSGYNILEITSSVIPGTNAVAFFGTTVSPGSYPDNSDNISSFTVHDDQYTSGVYSLKFTVTYAGNYSAMGTLFAMLMVDIINFVP